MHEQIRGASQRGQPGQSPASIRVTLSSGAVYPSRVERAFSVAAELGYDGVEVMVWSDRDTQSADSLRRLSAEYGVAVSSIHAPSLVVSQSVWGRFPGPKLERSVDLALELGAPTVVVHPPFRWQARYATMFAEHVRALNTATGVQIAVENMFPWRWRHHAVNAYLPGWDPTERDYEHVTLDLSHAAVAHQDSLELLHAMRDRISHIHLADGTDRAADEHLVPGRGDQPCAEVLTELAASGWAGDVAVEIQTRRAPSDDHVMADLRESLQFTRQHLAAGARDGVRRLSRQPQFAE